MSIIIRIHTLTTAATALALAGPATAQPAGLLGFSPPAAAAERALEVRFDAGLSAPAIRERMKLMAAEPNQVGSPHDRANAEYTLAQYQAWGWDAHIETFSALYPTPKVESLDLLDPAPYAAVLTEPPLPGDLTSTRQAGGLPAWVAYGGDGDITAPLIYVNYGMPADYEALQRMGLSVKGKIVITRYGGGWRGLKPKLAYEHGAVGCIIYSDPAEDGFATADPYPKGPARPEHGLQRGSVQDVAVETGDPLTPGYGAVEGAPRISPAEAKTLLHIPTLPISWGEAIHFLAPLGGPVAPKAWRGALPITYHVGGDGPRAHLVIQADWSQKPIYDVIAMMRGSVVPDEWVVRGNHRDGWVFGAQDPLSGQTAEMEEAKSIGAQVRSGWRPARTIVYASWDGEEPGLVGSTEWAEAHAAELQAKAVLYINSDTNDRGFLNGEASYSLRGLVDQAAADVPDPETGASVRDRALARLEVEALAPTASPEFRAMVREAAESGSLALGDLGSGSDYTPFVQHLGIASINLGFGGEGQSNGVYHSAYDTFEHFDRFGDPGFVYGVALARTVGRIVLRTADAEVLPFRFDNLAAKVASETAELERLVVNRKEHALAVNALIDRKAFALAADPTQSWGPPDRESVPAPIDFTPLEQAAAALRTSAQAFDAAATGPSSPRSLAAANLILQRVEQTLTSEAGLPRRPWYRHLLYAPGVLTGYGAKTLPGVREAIEAGRWDEARDYIGRTAQVLMAASARIDAAARALAG
ncbi:MAG TPA: transferrin receptor-like dimerization domain-containing protein [Caulobacteraceae bacterium]|jgi:N-acetylated-alpha-linked acidic dipeptidase|nr:transferrin receptor-like dimerization domain-containing protein [Caulobacteraceae bacterium]